MFKPSSKYFLLTVPRRHFFCGLFLLFPLSVCHAVLSVPCSGVVTCWERDDLLALLCMMFFVFLLFSHMVSWVRCGF